MTFSQAFANRIPYSENLISKLEDSIRIAIGHNKGQVKLAKRPQSRGDTYYCGLQFIANSSYANYVQLDNRSTEWVVAKAIKKGASSASTWIGSRFRFDKEGGVGPKARQTSPAVIEY